MNPLLSSINQIKGRRILVIGDMMVDRYISGDATRISPEAPVPVVHVSGERDVAGGAGNVAVNITSLGGCATACGMIGSDDAGNALVSLLKKHGVNFPKAFRKDKTDTIVKSRVIVRNQQLCRLDRELPPAAYSLDAPEIYAALRDELSRADAVVLSDYAKGAISEKLVNTIRDAARSRNIIVALDPKPRRRLAFNDVDLITPNKSEALELAGISPEECGNAFPAEDACRRIWEKFRPRNLVITLGADGMLLSREGKIITTIPTYAREVFDVSGAGDTVIATLTLALSAGIAIEEAADLANTAAGVVVGKFGTATATPEEILNYHK